MFFCRWPRIGEPHADEMMMHNHHDSDVDSDIDMNNDGFSSSQDANQNPSAYSSSFNQLYLARDRVPPIMMCLSYDPLVSMQPNIARTEWEQKIGGLPAFHIYCMSRAIYSSSSNPLLKPEHFMPEATDMSATERWKEYMGEGDNPLINFYVAGKFIIPLQFISASISLLSITNKHG